MKSRPRCRACLLGALLLAAAARPAHAFEVFQKKSVSASGQFLIYCDDLGSRLRLTTVVEGIKREMLALLGENQDRWKYPIIVNVNRPNAALPGMPVSQVRLIEVGEGFKVQFDFCLGANPLDVRLEQQIVRAFLLEYSCRDHPPALTGGRYLEPPAWLVEGAVEIFHRRDAGTKSDIYKTLIDSNTLPKLEDLLAENTSNLDSTSLALYRACSVGLVQLLVDLPNGRARLSDYLRDPARDNSRIDDLLKHFPTLAAGGQSLEKWWALSLARLSAEDRYLGLSLEETDRRITALLTLDLPVNKTGETKKFTLDQFRDFIKIKESRAALTRMSGGFLALQPIANPQFIGVVLDYQKLTAELARGRTRGIAERIAAAANDRRMILQRMSDIADYMNWFEATQVTERSRSFDSYLKTATELAAPQPRRKDPISRYLDSLEIEFQ